ncbi:MAG TPA: nickel pincer cofactor biosynthesis protein LarC, partial [Candidatus Saccharimonadales bacterium]|nr:nickel pincer cofactor biosynthesis protein LarC [Candidatus Saccharimonadales bacterium]
RRGPRAETAVKLAYFDPLGGASGDMILGALVDAGAPLDELRAGLSRLAVSGYSLEAGHAERAGIRAARVQVRLEGGPQPHRHLRDIRDLLARSELPDPVRERAGAVFERLARAEAKVHGTGVEVVHFHEVGAVDAVVDVVGACLGLALLGVEEVRFGRLPLGRGWVEAAHGRIPLPAPATVELLEGVPVELVDTEGETVTPTGAALLTTLGRCAPLPPGAVLRRAGYGAGAREFADRPNLLRVLLAEAGDAPRPGEVAVLTAAVDDMSPEHLPFLMERLFEGGALDVYFTPLTMKKSRPGVEVTVLAPPALEAPLAAELLRHSTSLGLRVRREARLELPREVVQVATEFGPVRVKLARLPEGVRAVPEYEDCAELARRHGRPLAEVFEAARRAAARRGPHPEPPTPPAP